MYQVVVHSPARGDYTLPHTLHVPCFIEGRTPAISQITRVGIRSTVQY